MLSYALIRPQMYDTIMFLIFTLISGELRFYIWANQKKTNTSTFPGLCIYCKWINQKKDFSSLRFSISDICSNLLLCFALDPHICWIQFHIHTTSLIVSIFHSHYSPFLCAHSSSPFLHSSHMLCTAFPFSYLYGTHTRTEKWKQWLYMYVVCMSWFPILLLLYLPLIQFIFPSFSFGVAKKEPHIAIEKK